MNGITIGGGNISVSCGSVTTGGKGNLIGSTINQTTNSFSSTFENIQVCIYPSGTMRTGKCPSGVKGISMILFGVKN
jgi:hypothetical protein